MRKTDFTADGSAILKAKAVAESMATKFQIERPTYLIVVNFDEPSYRHRLYVFKNGRLIETHHVSHGSRSSCTNKAFACKFSNKVGSHMSSLGAMKTGEIYYGKHGKSLKLIGLEKGKNNLVKLRHIVVHAADYVTDDYILRNGRAGCSWGCLAVDPAISSRLIDMIEGGCFVYIHHS